MRNTATALVLVLGGVATIVSAVAAPADGAATGELTIHASGFTHTRGHAVAKVFAPGDNVRKRARWQAVAAIEGGAAVFNFSALPVGRYAVVVFHDQNDNLEIDHGLLGPSEPLGFSGGFVLSLLSGLPDFERLQFEFKPPAQAVQVRVK